MSFSTSPIVTLTTASLSSLYSLSGLTTNYNVGSYLYSANTNTSPFNSKLNADYDRLTIRGIDVGKTLETIADRLCIVLDTSKHEKFAALKRAYDQYKMVEALCDVSNITD